MRPDVCDLYSIIPNHFIQAGPVGLQHFWHLMNLLITNVNLCSIDDLNSVFWCILHRGHGKIATCDRSYRTISSCTVLAKGLDSYIGDLYGAGSAEQQADTQFQGDGSSHALAALLLTETNQQAIHTDKQPLYCLLLDAKSCYDKILAESVIRQAYLAGTRDQGLLYINHRLKNRKTVCEYDKILMGPIEDKIGLEQGGKNSDKFHKLCNNSQLSTAQTSGLGINLKMGPTTTTNNDTTDNNMCPDIHIASIGQADDVALFYPFPQKFCCTYQELLQTTPCYSCSWEN